VNGIAELLSERAAPNGWEYDAQIAFEDGSLKRLALRLSWFDYQHWVPDGSVAPARVAEAVLRVLAAQAHRFAAMESIDASTVRRRIERGDEEVRAAIAG
jgi:hypothetical protein